MAIIRREVSYRRARSPFVRLVGLLVALTLPGLCVAEHELGGTARTQPHQALGRFGGRG